MALIIMIIAWALSALGLLLRNPNLMYFSLLAAIILTVAVARHFQANLYQRENLRKDLVNVRNGVINTFQEYNKIEQVYTSYDQLDRKTIKEVVDKMFEKYQHLKFNNNEWLWLNLNEAEHNVHVDVDKVISVTGDKIVPYLREVYDSLLSSVEIYSNDFNSLRKKSQSLFWQYLYSVKGFEYLDRLSLPEVSRRMVEEAVDTRNFLERVEVEPKEGAKL